MINEKPPAPSPLLVVRVLGAADAAESRGFALGSVITVGRAFANDIVLRDRSVGDSQIRLSLGAAAAGLQIVEGEAQLLGCRLTAPAAVSAPPYVPILIGEVAIALGDPASERWVEAERLLKAARAQAPPLPAVRPQPSRIERAGEWIGRWRWRLLQEGRRAAPVALIAAALGLLAFAGASLEAPTPRPPTAASVRAALIRAGFSGLRVSTLSSGRLRISGAVADQAAKGRLEHTMNALNGPFQLAVVTGDMAVREVQDVFLAGGVSVTAQADGRGGVAVIASRHDDPGRVDLLRRQALHEVRGLTSLSLAFADQSPASDADPGGDGRRVVLISGDDGGFVATADGSKYFPGATLPTGQKIASIGKTYLDLDQDGERSRISF